MATQNGMSLKAMASGRSVAKGGSLPGLQTQGSITLSASDEAAVALPSPLSDDQVTADEVDKAYSLLETKRLQDTQQRSLLHDVFNISNVCTDGAVAVVGVCVGGLHAHAPGWLNYHCSLHCRRLLLEVFFEPGGRALVSTDGARSAPGTELLASYFRWGTHHDSRGGNSLCRYATIANTIIIINVVDNCYYYYYVMLLIVIIDVVNN